MTGIFAIAVERYNPRRRRWTPDIVHLKAEDCGHARNQFCMAEPNRKTSRIVAVGPAIGFFCDDDDGERISPDR